MEPTPKKKNIKAIAIAAIAAVVVIAAIVVAAILMNQEPPIGDAYFKTAGNRLVYTAEIKNTEVNFNAVKMHQVYKVDGETVRNYSLFYEFKDDYSANKALESIKSSVSRDVDVANVEIYGKYVGIIYEDDLLENTTTTEIREEIKQKEAYDLYMNNRGGIKEEE